MPHTIKSDTGLLGNIQKASQEDTASHFTASQKQSFYVNLLKINIHTYFYTLLRAFYLLSYDGGKYVVI